MKLFLFILLFLSQNVIADAIPMSDFRMLRRGMNEAEILYRVGVYDHETVRTDFFNNVLDRTWYYIPSKSQPTHQRWITEISFDFRGRVRRIDRYRPQN